MWVYLRSEPELYTVGFYDPAGKWHTDSDWSTSDEAANRVAWLNGSGPIRTFTRHSPVAAK